jgi:hypothetical protein
VQGEGGGMIGYCSKCGQTVTDILVDAGGWCPDHGRVFVDWQRPWPKLTVLDACGQRIARGMETVALDGRPEGIVREVRDEEDGPVVVVESYEFGSLDALLTIRRDPDDDLRCYDVEVRP